MIIDVITYNGEMDLFEIRYNILKDYVDEFIVIEFDKTFSGKSKPFYSHTLIGLEKVRIIEVFEDQYNKYKDLALSSSNTEYGKGAKHWITEFCQKESIKDCLTHLKDDDTVFIGDCDETWKPDIRYQDKDYVVKLKLLVYTYYLNQRSGEDFWGTIYGQYKYIKNRCLNELRTESPKTYEYFGWHFTSLKDNLKRKLTDSYTNETYATETVLSYLEQNIQDDKDFLGRNFTYRVDESEWPEYLKDHREKYKHLCKKRV